MYFTINDVLPTEASPTMPTFKTTLFLFLFDLKCNVPEITKIGEPLIEYQKTEKDKTEKTEKDKLCEKQ